MMTFLWVGRHVRDLFVAFSPLFVHATQITESGVTPLPSNESLEKDFENDLCVFGTVCLSCEDDSLQHV